MDSAVPSSASVPGGVEPDNPESCSLGRGWPQNSHGQRMAQDSQGLTSALVYLAMHGSHYGGCSFEGATPWLCLWAGEPWPISFLLHLTGDLCDVLKSSGTGFCTQLDIMSTYTHSLPLDILDNGKPGRITSSLESPRGLTCQIPAPQTS